MHFIHESPSPTPELCDRSGLFFRAVIQPCRDQQNSHLRAYCPCLVSQWKRKAAGLEQVWAGEELCQDHQPWTSAGVRVFTRQRRSWMKVVQRQESDSGLKQDLVLVLTSPPTNFLLPCGPRMLLPPPLTHTL